MAGPNQRENTCGYHVCHFGHSMLTLYLNPNQFLDDVADVVALPNSIDYNLRQDQVVMETRALLVALAMRLADFQSNERNPLRRQRNNNN